jgi:hypothetical protein
MADQKLTALTEETALSPDNLFYYVVASGTTSEKITTTTLHGGGTLGQGGNLVRNSPGQIAVDGAEPQWWDDVANATITDEDAAGEGVEEKQERVFKVVTTANDVYGYQTLTFADEDLLDAGQTVVSFGCWIWCAAATKASIGIFGTNLTLQESGQHSGGSSWEYFSVENQTLHAADTSIEVRLIVDTGTAYFCMPMLCVGPIARPWHPRGLRYVQLERVSQIDTTGTDVAWSDTDCTANTDPLAVIIVGRLTVSEPNGTPNSYMSIGPASALVSADSHEYSAYVSVVGTAQFSSSFILACDDGQLLRYIVEEVDNDSDLTYKIFINGYWMWE